MTARISSLRAAILATRAQVHLPDMFPPFLYNEVRKHHGVIACEGSMFKSKFANALTTMMIGALGIAAAENKAFHRLWRRGGRYGPACWRRLCARYCRQSLVVTRNSESQAVLSALGVPSELGTDTAWTFEPHPPEYGRKALTDAGWDGRAPVLVVCPINPFWWPVKASDAEIGRACGRRAPIRRATTGRSISIKPGAEVDASL